MNFLSIPLIWRNFSARAMCHFEITQPSIPTIWIPDKMPIFRHYPDVLKDEWRAKAAFRGRIDLFKNTLEKPIKSGKKVGGYQTKSLSLQSLQLMTNLATACQSLFTHHSHTHTKVYFGKWILKFHIHHWGAVFHYLGQAES